jgi:thiamine biosynthesis lipoprotein
VAIAAPGTVFAAQRIVAPGTLALATSGVLPQGHRGRGATSHLIDPARDRPVAHDLLSVSVLAPSAMAADALATALTVMGPEAGPRFAEANRIPALFLRGGDATPVETMTASFATHVIA